MRKLLNRKIVEQNRILPICLEEFTDYTMWCQTIKNPKEWEELGETTIRTTSKPFIGGAIRKKVQAESTDGRQPAGSEDLLGNR